MTPGRRVRRPRQWGHARGRRVGARRDPAWLWYGIAGAAMLAVLILELTGVLGGLGP